MSAQTKVELRKGLTRPRRDPRAKKIEKFIEARREAAGSPTLSRRMEIQAEAERHAETREDTG